MTIITLLMAAALTGQDSVELRWKLTKGTELQVEWTGELEQKITVDDREPIVSEVKIAIRGRMTVKKVLEDGAECGLKISDYEVKGTIQGEKIDLVVKDGKVVKAEGASDKGAAFRELMVQPARMKITTRGEYRVLENEGLARLFAGQGSWFGSLLPEKPVTEGSTWKETLQTRQSKAMGGPSFEVTRRFAGITESGRAKIETDEDHEFEVQGLKMKFNLKSEDLFDVKGGYCVRSTATTDGTGGGAVMGQNLAMVAKAVLTFRASPLDEY
jgi:hypothetical protein